MVKIILFSFVLLLTGCASDPIKFNTSVKETFVPIIYSPAPPVIERPELPIHKISAEQLKEDGEVVKFYKATIKTLIGYSKELKKALYEYNKINKSYKAQEDKLKEKFKKNAEELPKE